MTIRRGVYNNKKTYDMLYWYVEYLTIADAANAADGNLHKIVKNQLRSS